MEERLHKIMSAAGVASRRESEQMIAAGRVAVDGEVVTTLGYKTDIAKHRVTVDGKPISREQHVYFLLNKPKGYVCTVKDQAERKTVLDFFKDVPQHIYPVGRLDLNTEGLLLLTNDGEFMNAVLHPSRQVDKIYLVVVEGLLTDAELHHLADGVEIKGGVTAPADVRLLNYDRGKQRTEFELTIHEGRNRQIRRMCEAIGHDVVRLKRIEFAGLTLSGVERGQYRPLTKAEVSRLRRGEM